MSLKYKIKIEYNNHNKEGESMKKIKLLTVFATAVGLFLLANVASAINLPTFMEFDLDNWTRLYRDGEMVLSMPDTAPLCTTA